MDNRKNWIKHLPFLNNLLLQDLSNYSDRHFKDLDFNRWFKIYAGYPGECLCKIVDVRLCAKFPIQMLLKVKDKRMFLAYLSAKDVIEMLPAN